MTATDQPLEKFTQGDFDRFSIQHEWIKGCIGGCSALVRAPIDLSKPGLRVLDAATANGIWMMDVQTLTVPETEFIGFDIVPDLHTHLPQNIMIQAQNLLEPFPEAWKNASDLVHQRLLLVVFPDAQVRQIVARLIDTVKPGGWIQLFEGDASKRVYSPKAASFEFFHRFAEEIKSGTVGRYMGDYLREAGMVNVHHEEVQCRLGAVNPDAELGKMGVKDFQCAAKGFMDRIDSSVVGASEEEWRDLPETISRDVEAHGAAVTYHVVWAQKPLN